MLGLNLLVVSRDVRCIRELLDGVPDTRVPNDLRVRESLVRG